MPSRPARHGETKSAGVGFVCSPVREIASCEKPPCAIGADDAEVVERRAPLAAVDQPGDEVGVALFGRQLLSRDLMSEWCSCRRRGARSPEGGEQLGANEVAVEAGASH